MGTFEWSVGTISILISAITEAGYFIYFLSNPLGSSWNRLGVSYIGAAILYGIYYIITNQSTKTNKDDKKEKKPRNWIFAIIWNLVIAGFGYWGRFSSQDTVSPLLYSALSYTGLLSGYSISVALGQDALTKTDIVSILGVLFSILGLTFTPILMN
jgi:drug/metabolite transporter (DMT)-like permease